MGQHSSLIKLPPQNDALQPVHKQDNNTPIDSEQLSTVSLPDVTAGDSGRGSPIPRGRPPGPLLPADFYAHARSHTSDSQDADSKTQGEARRDVITEDEPKTEAKPRRQPRGMAKERAAPKQATAGQARGSLGPSGGESPLALLSNKGRSNATASSSARAATTGPSQSPSATGVGSRSSSMVPTVSMVDQIKMRRAAEKEKQKQDGI